MLISAIFTFSPKLFSPFTHCKVIATLADFPGSNNVFAKASVLTTSSEICVQLLLSSLTNFNPAGIWSLISFAYPAISPSFVTVIS